MGLNPAALHETASAFDAVADVYGEENASNPVLSEMRRLTVDALLGRLQRGSSILDLGCGPGPDAITCASEGHRVLAIDWSQGMVDEARRRVEQESLQALVEVRRLGIHELDRLEARTFDGILSNLGPLNCVPDLGRAAALIADRLSPGGVFVASAIGRVCPWEIARYGLVGLWGRARVRFSSEFVPVPLREGRIWTRYYYPANFQRVFENSGLETLSLRALGILVPPPYLQGFAKRHPRWVSLLQRVEESIAHAPGVRQWGDHFLLVMRKRRKVA